MSTWWGDCDILYWIGEKIPNATYVRAPFNNANTF